MARAEPFFEASLNGVTGGEGGGFPVEDAEHQFARIGSGGGQRPGEAFCGGELRRGAARLLMTPKNYESPYGPGSTAEPLQLRPGGAFRGRIFGQVLGAFYEPFDEDAGFFVTQPPREGVVRQDVAQ